MESSNIHKSLLELEGSLKDLQSARTQVNSISVKSEQMLDVYTKILHHLESLETKFEIENANLLNQLTQKYEKVSIEISSKSDTLEEKSAKYIDMLSDSYRKVQQKINDLENSVNDAKDKINNTDFNKSLKEFESKLDVINKSILSFQKELTEFRNSIIDNLQIEFKRNTDNYNSIISKVNDVINESNKVLKENTDCLENKIEELGKNVNVKIDELRNNLNTYFQTELKKNTDNYNGIISKVNDVFNELNKVLNENKNYLENNIEELGKNIDAKIDALYNSVSNSNSKIVNLIEDNRYLKKQNKIIISISVVSLFMSLVILILLIVN